MENKTFWNNYAEKRPDPNNKVVNAFIKDKLNTINKIIPNFDDYSILDVGCGNGRFLFHFKSKKKFGIDYAEKMIKEAKKYIDNSIIKVADGYNLPFADESFGIVFGGCYLHNLSKDNKALQEAKRVSKKYVVLVEPNPLNPFIALFNIFSGEEDIKNVFKFNKKYYKKIFKANGFNVKCFTRGMITPNRTPKFLLPLLKVLEKTPLPKLIGFYYVIIGEKI